MAANAARRRHALLGGSAIQYSGRQPYPERITQALDLRGLYGPEVDVALGGREPMVDEWEAGLTIPTIEQIRLLAVMTGFRVDWFYRKPHPQIPWFWLCRPGRCERVDTASLRPDPPAQLPMFPPPAGVS